MGRERVRGGRDWGDRKTESDAEGRKRERERDRQRRREIERERKDMVSRDHQRKWRTNISGREFLPSTQYNSVCDSEQFQVGQLPIDAPVSTVVLEDQIGQVCDPLLVS